MTHLQTKIPFSGFYDTALGQLPNSDLEYYSEGLNNDEYIELCDLVYMHTDYELTQKKIATKYVEIMSKAINGELKTNYPLQFIKVQSPKYYNFENDEIIVNIDLRLLKQIVKTLKPEILEKCIRDNHSSYDGFISFYSNDIKDWNKKASEFDINEICTIIQAFCIQWGEGLLHDIEYKTIDYCSGNGIGQAINFITDETALARINELLDKARASDAA